MNRSNLQPFRQLALYGVLVLVIFWILFPLWWAIVLSIKHPADFFTAKFLPFVQFSPTLDHWRYEWNAFDDPAGMGRSLLGSLLVASASTAAALALGTPAAFGLRLRRRWGRRVGWLLGFFLLPRIIPPVIIALPFSHLMRLLHLGDTYPALVIAHTTLSLPLAILLPYSAMADVPPDLLDAARVDGCTLFDALRLIMVPLLAPVLSATAILCFALSWNEFLFALMNVQQRVQTVTLAVASLLNKDGVEWSYVGSHLVMVTLPPVVFVLLARRYVVRGLTFGAIPSEPAQSDRV